MDRAGTSVVVGRSSDCDVVVDDGSVSARHARLRWEGDRIKFDAPSGAAKGATGTVHVDPSAVRVEVDLPFLLRAVKGTVESKINEKLDQLISKA